MPYVVCIKNRLLYYSLPNNITLFEALTRYISDLSYLRVFELLLYCKKPNTQYSKLDVLSN